IYVKINDMELMALACLWIIFKQDASADKIPSVIKLHDCIILQFAQNLYINQEEHLLKYEKKVLIYFSASYMIIYKLYTETDNLFLQIALSMPNENLRDVFNKYRTFDRKNLFIHI
ncbi:hypothetical protein ALC56_10920, partial [Trachymyrmex septentrionalis]